MDKNMIEALAKDVIVAARAYAMRERIGTHRPLVEQASIEGAKVCCLLNPRSMQNISKTTCP
jgi:hypothetical protein